MGDIMVSQWEWRGVGGVYAARVDGSQRIFERNRLRSAQKSDRTETRGAFRLESIKAKP